MREIFSIRFFAAVGAVILSFLVVSAIVGGAEPVTEEGADADTQPRRVDLIERVQRFEDEGAVFSVVDGAAASSTVLVQTRRGTTLRPVSGSDPFSMPVILRAGRPGTPGLPTDPK